MNKSMHNNHISFDTLDGRHYELKLHNDKTCEGCGFLTECTAPDGEKVNLCITTYNRNENGFMIQLPKTKACPWYLE